MADAAVVLAPEPRATRPNPVISGETRYGRMLFLATDLFIGASLQQYGEYSELELQHLRPHVPEGGVVLDIGANVGALTLAFARWVGPAGAVFAFEPQPFVFYLLCGNVAWNGLFHVNCQRVALAHDVGVTMIHDVDYTDRQNFGSFQCHAQDGQIPTNITMIDAFRLNRCDLIKIDVEGMEKMVLRGGYQTIRRHRPILWVECERDEKTARHIELIKWIHGQLDYDCELIATPLFNPGNWKGDPTVGDFAHVFTHNLLCTPR